MAGLSDFANAISSIESGGKYDILGPRTKSGDQAYGKYQIMGANIGPWSKEILGQELTPEQFLSNPQAQDAVFQGKFGQYVNQYGPEGAAQAWIGGPGGVGKLDRKDSLGTSIGAYGQKFMERLGSPSEMMPGSQAPAFNQPPQQVASLPAYGWSPGQQQQAMPAQSPFQPTAAATSPAAPGYSPPATPSAPQMNMPQATMPGVLRPKVDPSQLLALLSNAPASVRALYSRG